MDPKDGNGLPSLPLVSVTRDQSPTPTITQVSLPARWGVNILKAYPHAGKVTVFLGSSCHKYDFELDELEAWCQEVLKLITQMRGEQAMQDEEGE